MTQLDKNFQPKKFEDEIYKAWEASGFFNPDNLPGKRKKTFSIILPPPNATGILHIGHASMLAYQDIMVRYHRLKGDKTLWLPGTDHAAIATNSVVEKKLLKEENKKKEDLGRKVFVEKVEEFVENSRDTIRRQIRAMGASLDWSREKFTLDEDVSLAVRTAFKKMYDDGLIYRGYRIVNWCPKCLSTLSDDEVEYKETKSPFYYFKYGPVVIGTARPETKFSDKVIIVHPDDKRYKDLIGQEFTVEWINGPIQAKVIADEVAEMEKGTGAMTITPAHSFVDFDLAQKYNLKVEEIINPEGKLTEVAGDLAGWDVKEARKKVVEILEQKGLVEKIDEDYVHNLSVCYRCGTAVEPLPSKQWFIDVNKKIPNRNKSLKELASEVVRKGDIKIIPERFNKTYFQWMDNLRDWCISRQIWYGHRIPVWMKGEEIYVGTEAPKGKDWIQDEDTLDTWFSSSLWTFSTLGWPKETKDLKDFHPTSVLETGYDILFMWVSRMIFLSTYLLKEKPFETVYLHGLVRDKQGRKMSKSLGNGINPLEMIEKFGTDALRLSMTIGATPGNDIRLYEEKIAGYRNFVNKLWNISRFILDKTHQPEADQPLAEETRDKIQTKSKIFSQGLMGRWPKNPNTQTLADEWILSEFNKIIESTTKNLDEFKFSQAGEELYEFTWNKLADWYLEIAKIEENKDEILLYILEKLLILWHPFCPYITEVIWREFETKELLMIQSWPTEIKFKTRHRLKDFELLREMVTAIRNVRSENQISPKEVIDCAIAIKDKSIIEKNQILIEGLAKVKLVSDTLGMQLPLSFGKLSLNIQPNETLAISKEKEKAKLENYIKIQKQKLANSNFVDKAPAEVVAQENEKLKQAEERLAKHLQ